jgi:holo-[acyl-carrier protein] synthase
VIVGIGTDIVEVGRFERLSPGVFERIFTTGEQEYCRSRGKGGAASFAARFAAKEAVSKALGTGISGGIRFHDIEVESGQSGAPVCRLHGKAQERLSALGGVRVHLSLSHEKGQALAFAILEA